MHQLMSALLQLRRLLQVLDGLGGAEPHTLWIGAVSLGLTSFLADQEGRDYDTVVFNPPGNRVFKKLLVEDDRIIGAQMVGEVSNAGVVVNYMRNARDASDIKERVLQGTLSHGLLRGTPPR